MKLIDESFQAMVVSAKGGKGEMNLKEMGVNLTAMIFSS